MLLWIMNLGFAGGGGVTPPPQGATAAAPYSFPNQGGDSGEDERRRIEFRKRIRIDDDDVFHIIKMWLNGEN
jgi:hypothetical protein